MNLQQAENNVITTKRDLMNLIGLPPDTAFTVDSKPHYGLPKEPTKKEAFQEALQGNIQYRSDLLSLNIVRRNLHVAKDNTLPQLNLTLTGTTGNGPGRGPDSGFESLFNSRDNSVQAQLDLDIPIRSFQLKQQLLNARVSLAQAEINLDQEVRNLKTTIYNNIADIESNRKQIKLSKNAINLRKKDQEYLNAKLQHGLSNVFEVSTRQQELSQAMNRLVSDEISYVNSMTVLYANMGILLDVWKIEINY